MHFFSSRISLSHIVTGVLGLVLLVTAGRVQAQRQAPAPSPDSMADRKVTSMTEQLDLSQNQQAEVRSILVSTLKEQQTLMQEAQRNSEGVDPQELRQKMQKMQEQKDKQLAEVLDEEQMEKYRAQQQQKRQQQQQQRQQRSQQNANPADAALRQLDAQLDLTDEQQAEIRTILEDQVAQAQKLKEQLADADAQQRREIMKKAQKMRQQTNQRIEEALTEEQAQTLRELRKQQREKMKQRRQQQQQQQPTPEDDQ